MVFLWGDMGWGFGRGYEGGEGVRGVERAGRGGWRAVCATSIRIRSSRAGGRRGEKGFVFFGEVGGGGEVRGGWGDEEIVNSKEGG